MNKKSGTKQRFARFDFNIEGFKAIAKADIVVDGLTVVVGANSSGKSSLGQALLVLSRAMESRDGRVKLNDQVLSLGRFSDVLNMRSDYLRLSVTRTDKPGSKETREEPDTANPGQLEFKNRATFDLDGSMGAKTETLVKREMFVQNNYHRINTKIPDELLSSELLRPMGHLSVVQRNSSKTQSTETFAVLTPREGANFRSPGFKLVSKLDFLTGLVSRHSFSYRSRRNDSLVLEDVSVSEIREEFDSWVSDQAKELNLSDLSKIGALNKKLNEQGDAQFAEGLSQIISKTDKLLPIRVPPELTQLLVNLWSKHKNQKHIEQLISQELSEEFMDEEHIWIEDIRDSHYFGRQPLGVGFLGPLRKRSLSRSFSETFEVSNAPIGTDGGQLASVLYGKFQDPDLRLYPTPRGDTKSLKTAISDWLTFFDMPHVIEAEETQDGYIITLAQTENKRDAKRRVDEYGTGVSQLLPAIALILMADEDEISLIEQPELHLHPQAQIKLADFLMRYSPIRNILVETHSEYLVTRLRRNVALGVVQNGIPRPSLYFVEPRDGYSEVIEAEIPDSGGDDSWPDRFSGFTESDELDILESHIQSEESASG